MHLYKHFWKMVKSNKTAIIIYAMIMAVMIFSIGMAAKQNFQDNEDQSYTQSYHISYVDRDQSELSEGLLAYLASKNVLTDYRSKSQEEINNLVFFTVTNYHLEIPEGFEAAVNRGDEKAVEYSSFVTTSSYIYSINNDIASYVNAYKTFLSDGHTASEAVALAEKAVDQQVAISLWDGGEGYQEGSVKEWIIYQTTIFLIYLTFGMLALTIGNVIINNNKENVSKRMDASPVPGFKRSLTNMIGLFSFGLLLWIIYLAVVWALGNETMVIRERMGYLAITVLAFLVCNCCLTAFLSSFPMKTEVMSMVVNVVGLSLSFLSGVFVPQWLLSDVIVNISKFFPFYWMVDSMNRIFTGYGAGLSFDAIIIYRNFGIEMLFAAVFFLLSVAVHRLRK